MTVFLVFSFLQAVENIIAVQIVAFHRETAIAEELSTQKSLLGEMEEHKSLPWINVKL